MKMLSILIAIAMTSVATAGPVTLSGSSQNGVSAGIDLLGLGEKPVQYADNGTTVYGEAGDDIGTDLPDFAAMDAAEYGAYRRALDYANNANVQLPEPQWSKGKVAIVVSGVITIIGLVLWFASESTSDDGDSTVFNVTGDGNQFTTTGDNGYDKSAIDQSGNER